MTPEQAAAFSKILAGLAELTGRPWTVGPEMYRRLKEDGVDLTYVRVLEVVG